MCYLNNFVFYGLAAYAVLADVVLEVLFIKKYS